MALHPNSVSLFMGHNLADRSTRDETLRTQVLTDPHAPGMYRANGPLTNFEPFYKAFNVVEGDKMYRPENERVKIW